MVAGDGALGRDGACSPRTMQQAAPAEAQPVATGGGALGPDRAWTRGADHHHVLSGALEKGGQLLQVVEVLAEMLHAGVERNTITYYAAVRAREEGGQ